MPHCRCKYCGARRTLSRHPDEYLRIPRCRSCSRKTWRIDKYRAIERKKRPCICGAVYSFPHALGRGWCIHNAKLTHEDWETWHESTYGYRETTREPTRDDPDD